MQANDTSGLQVIKKEDKERRVTAFVKAHLDRSEQSGAPEAGEMLLVARSYESPVCRAVTALLPDLKKAGISIRMIMTAVDGGIIQPPANVSTDLVETATVRIVCDPRLYEAHEQLVLDGETCWIGDCMRREPAKCDAYENYCQDNGATAKSAALTFARLWQLSTPAAPLAHMIPRYGFKDTQAAGLLSKSATGSDKSAPTVLTRH